MKSFSPTLGFCFLFIWIGKSALSAQTLGRLEDSFFPSCTPVPGVEIRIFKKQIALEAKSEIYPYQSRARLTVPKDWKGHPYLFTQTAEIRNFWDWEKYWKKYFKEVPELPADLDSKMILLHPGFPHRRDDRNEIGVSLDQICLEGHRIKVFDHFDSMPFSILSSPFGYYTMETPLPAPSFVWCTIYAYILPRSDDPVDWITTPPPGHMPTDFTPTVPPPHFLRKQ